MILHAAVVEKEGRALIMPGEPGSGKSTLCAALCHHGWRLLSDELTLIDMESLEVIPLCRPISLKNQSIPVIREYLGEDCILGPMVKETTKGIVSHVKPPSASVAEMSKSARICWFVFPKYEDQAAVSLTERARAETFLEIAKNSFNYSFHGQSGMVALQKIVSSSSSHELRYSRLEDAENIINSLAPPVYTEADVEVCSAPV
jgi:HprK-related kinase A